MKMKKLTLTFFLLFSMMAFALAQMKVSGKISDAAGEALIGASVVEKGTNNGTITDIDGNFSLNVKETSTLQVSMVGFEAQDIAVGGQSTINISMVEGASLSEIVVTAFGISKDQKVLSYATQPINTKTFSQARELNVANSLAGRVAGLDIVRSSSGVGGSSRIVLRGDRSITGNNQALIVIDGVPMDNSNFSSGNANGGRDGGDGLSSVNPDDIESMNILRGAAATALYGSRAANGAVIISTKKGAARKGLGITLNSSFQAEQAIILQKFQNQFGQGSEGKYNSKTELNWGPRMRADTSVDAWGPSPNAVGKTYPFVAQPNNYQDFYSQGSQLSNSIAFSGGNDKTQAYFSYTNVGATGIVDNNKLKRNIFNLRMSNQLGDKFTLDSKVTYLNEVINNRQQTGESFANLQRHVLRLPRNVSLETARDIEYTEPITGRNRQNFWNQGSNGGQNPYWIKNRVIALDNRDRITGFSSLTYKLNSAFSVMARAGVDQFVDKFEGKWYNDTYIIADNGEYQTSWRQVREVNLDLLAFYKKEFGKDLTLDATVGGSIQNRSQLDQSSSNGGLNRENLFAHSNFRNSTTTRSVDEREKQGVFATADFTFKNAFTVTASVRNDWSSTLPKANQSYFFPGVGVSALISEMVKMPNAISFTKLRGSYAITGNDALPYLLTQTYTLSPGGVNGFITRDVTKPFEDLKPELTTALEIGLEMKFFNNRLGFDLGWYNSDSRNQLFRVPLPTPSGWSDEYINSGLVNNSGIELTLNVTPVKLGDFRWDIDLNYAANKNKLVELSENVKTLNLTNDFMNNMRAIEGKPLGEIFSRGYARNAKNEILVGADGIPQITGGSSVYIGNTRPDWTGGINNRISFKDFTLSFLISARMGGVVTSFTNAVIYADGLAEETATNRESYIFPGVLADGSANTKPITAEKYWTKVGGRNQPAGEVFTYDASNIRLRELTLSYNLPNKLVKNTPFQGASISLVGRNLFFIMNNAKGFDPELASGSQNTTVGVESFSLPSTRTIGVNLNLSF
jgi:TonB-linked SusC/RagA family outer membrane protein